MSMPHVKPGYQAGDSSAMSIIIVSYSKRMPGIDLLGSKLADHDIITNVIISILLQNLDELYIYHSYFEKILKYLSKKRLRYVLRKSRI